MSSLNVETSDVNLHFVDYPLVGGVILQRNAVVHRHELHGEHCHDATSGHLALHSCLVNDVGIPFSFNLQHMMCVVG